MLDHAVKSTAWKWMFLKYFWTCSFSFLSKLFSFVKFIYSYFLNPIQISRIIRKKDFFECYTNSPPPTKLMLMQRGNSASLATGNGFMHTRMHSHTHTYIHTFMLMCTHSSLHMLAQIHAHIHAETQTNRHLCIQIFTQINPCIYTHTEICGSNG